VGRAARPPDPPAHFLSSSDSAQWDSVSRRDRRAFEIPAFVYAVVGDGGFQMCLPELATLRRYGVPAKVLLIDNQNLGMVRQCKNCSSRLATRRQFGRQSRLCRDRARLRNRSLRVADPSAADATIAAFIAHAGPALLHAPAIRPKTCGR